MDADFHFIAPPVPPHHAYRKAFADAVVFTGDGRLLLQRRPQGWGASGGKLTLFGGHVEHGEEPQHTICRELAEELGACADLRTITPIGLIEERDGSGIDAVYLYLWRDTGNTISGCYEGTAEHYATLDAALAAPTLMDYARLALTQARKLCGI